MLTMKEANDATTLSIETEVSDALERRDPTPLETLRRAVRGLFELARRLPTGGVYLFGESGRMEDESEGPSAFEMLSRHVRAAQRAGELKAGDVSLMPTLIACTILGAADLAQHARAKPGTGASEAHMPPLLLLDLLATKGCN